MTLTARSSAQWDMGMEFGYYQTISNPFPYERIFIRKIAFPLLLTTRSIYCLLICIDLLLHKTQSIELHCKICISCQFMAHVWRFNSDTLSFSRIKHSTFEMEVMLFFWKS